MYALMFSSWLYISKIVMIATADIKILRFKPFQINGNSVKMWSVGPEFEASSVSACAAQCSKYVPMCYSFVYNRKSKLCTPGSWLIPSDKSFNSSLGTLYSVPGTFCDTSKVNFTVVSKGRVSSCIWLSNTIATYRTAVSLCKDLGSNLYTVKVPEKLNILLDAVKNFNVDHWIGLDDLSDEGVFKWVDDGSVWTNYWTLFAQNQPDDMLGEDCVQYSPIYYPINDYSCNYLSRFICEMGPIDK